MAQAYFYDVEDYNRLTGENVSLASGEAIVGVIGKIKYGDVITIGNESFNVVQSVDDMSAKMHRAILTNVVSTLIIVVDDLEEVASRYASCKDAVGDPMLCWTWEYRFDTDLDTEGQIELAKILDKYISAK